MAREILTLDGLNTAVKAYADGTKVMQDSFVATVDDFTKAICKIGKINTLYLPQVDKLPELSGDNLPYGQIIEEVMVNDFLPVSYPDYEADGTVKSSPRPTFDQAVYSYPMADQLFETSIPYSDFQRVSTDAASYAAFTSTSLQTLDSSTNAWNYAAKRQLLGIMSVDDGIDFTVVGDPNTWTDEQTASFIEQVLKQVEVASDINVGNILGHTAAAAPSLTLYIAQGVMPRVKVKALAGAINKEELAIPAKIKVIKDFGSFTGASGETSNVIALLVDDRGVRLHDDINEVESIAANFRVSNKRHLKQTGYISKYAFCHAFYKA